MAHSGARKAASKTAILPICDVCGFVLPKGCAYRHPQCDTNTRAAEEYEKARQAERPRFASVVQDLGEFHAEAFLRRYDSAPGVQAMIELLQRIARMPGICESRAKDICLLKYPFYKLTVEYPLYERG